MSPSIQNYLQRCLALIKTHGHMVQSLLGDHQTPSWSYSIGLSKTLGYELVLLGLPQDVATSFINDVAKRLAEGPIEDGADISGLANVAFRLRTFDGPMDPLRVAKQLGMAPKKVRFVQWPDPQGHFPGDEAYSFPLNQTFDDLVPANRRH